jgi:hypothetical protein
MLVVRIIGCIALAFLVLMACNSGGTVASGPVPVIFDTDMTTDCDDAGALAMLHALDRRGEARILATVVNNMGDGSAGATAAINAFYGRGDIPVGAYKGDVVGREAAAFFSAIASDTATYGHAVTARAQLPSALEVYRRVLSEANTNQVVIVSVGHLNNLYDLVRSGPDHHSPLSGVELIAQKVDHLVVMGGHYGPAVSERYPHGREHNFAARGSGPFTGPTLEQWPTRVVLSGYEIGEEILTGPLLAALDEVHPVRRAYAAHSSNPLVNGRMSWDQTAVLAAVRDPESYWDLSEPGRVLVEPDGSNTWVSDPNGRHRYLIAREDPGPEELAAVIEELMVEIR